MVIHLCLRRWGDERLFHPSGWFGKDVAMICFHQSSLWINATAHDSRTRLAVMLLLGWSLSFFSVDMGRILISNWVCWKCNFLNLSKQKNLSHPSVFCFNPFCLCQWSSPSFCFQFHSCLSPPAPCNTSNSTLLSHLLYCDSPRVLPLILISLALNSFFSPHLPPTPFMLQISAAGCHDVKLVAPRLAAMASFYDDTMS